MKNKSITLMYHSIGGAENKEAGAGLYSVEVEKFREQMCLVQSSKKSGDRPLVTLDDGLVDNYTNAYPILKELGLKAYFFVIVSKVGTSGYMNWEHLKELKNAGMAIGSHGMTHRLLTELEDKELNDEIRESKMILEKNLCRIDYFSIAFGAYNTKIIEKIKEAGYKGVFTSNSRDNDTFRFGRIAVKADWSIGYFERVVNGRAPLKSIALEMFLGSAKKILGVKNYGRIRAKLLG